MSSPTTSTSCPNCGTAGTGRFCAECGTPLSAICPGCQTAVAPTAKFCHRCGRTLAPGNPVAAPTAASGGSKGSLVPWAVAGLAFLCLFAFLAGQGFNRARGSALDAPATALPNPALDGGPMGAAMMGAMGGAPGTGPAPDISNMTPEQLAERLFNRIMLLSSEGKTDSIQFFAPMAIQSYQMVRDQQGTPWNIDQRYDVGRIAEVAGALPMAKAQADTILQQVPTHLLGLILAANVARQAGNTPAFEEYAAKFNQSKTAELARNRPEYAKHASEISAGL